MCLALLRIFDGTVFQYCPSIRFTNMKVETESGQRLEILTELGDQKILVVHITFLCSSSKYFLIYVSESWTRLLSS